MTNETTEIDRNEKPNPNTPVQWRRLAIDVCLIQFWTRLCRVRVLCRKCKKYQNQWYPIMAEELLVVLNRNENSGLGFSLLQKPGLPPIIYNILDDSPAAESGEVSDWILFWSKVGILPFPFDSWINKLFQSKTKTYYYFQSSFPFMFSSLSNSYNN